MLSRASMTMLGSEDNRILSGVFLIFLSLFLLFGGIQNIIFFLGVLLIGIPARRDAAAFTRQNIPFLFMVLFMILPLAIASGLEHSSLPVFLENLASILTIWLFVFVMSYASRHWPSQLLVLLVAIAVLSAGFGLAKMVYAVIEGGPRALLLERLSILGKGYNPIHAGSLLAVGILAAMALWPAARNGFRTYLAAAMAVMAVALLLTWSRGPIGAFVIALILAGISARLDGRAGFGLRLFFVSLLAWAAVTISGFVEPWLRAWSCDVLLALCRHDTLRIEIWSWVAEQVQASPWVGRGMSFRFPPPDKFHAHNGLFGTALSFGIPALFVYLVTLRLIMKKSDGLMVADLPRRFAALALPFGFAYMGADLASPFAFIRNHYLFLWLPLAMLMPVVDMPRAENVVAGRSALPAS